MLPKWQKHLPLKLDSQPHLRMETTSYMYGEAWRTFQKQNFGLHVSSTTYYSTVPITCTPTQIHHTQSLHYDKSLKRNSLRHNYRYNELRCNDISWQHIVLLCEISLQWSLSRTISRWVITNIVPISRWFIVLTFNNLCDVLLIYRR